MKKLIFAITISLFLLPSMGISQDITPTKSLEGAQWNGKEPPDPGIAVSQTQNHKDETEISSVLGDSTDKSNTVFSKRFQFYTGLGFPYEVSIGGKYRFSQTYFLEIETSGVPRIIKDGYLYLGVGASTTNYVHNRSPLYFDGEATFVLGNFPDLSALFRPIKPSGGIGFSLRGDMETRYGISLFVKLGGVGYFKGTYGGAILETGLSTNF